MSKKHSTSLVALAIAIACASLFVPAERVSAADPEIKLDAPASAKGLRVAVLPVVNTSSDADAVKTLEDVLRERVKSVDRSKAVFLMPADVERVLSNPNTLSQATRVADRWSKNSVLDSTAIGGLDSLLVADAVLVVKIVEWETKKFHNVGQGQSYTTIGLHFALLGIKDKKKLWSKDVREQRLAQEYDLSSGTVGYDDTGRIQSRNVNEPPRAQDVASDLVREALKKFPTK